MTQRIKVSDLPEFEEAPYLDSEAVEIAAPGTPVIAKPFDPDTLRRMVRELAA